MTNKQIQKKQIIYRSTHRGTKEMDILLGSFVKKNINYFSNKDLNDIQKLLFLEDEILYKWYFKNKHNIKIPNNRVSKLLKKFKL
tara:strand:+ start:6126 stop:6380 length:255 start_codon:yes stop_codon:yes gene_type:complete